VALFVAVDLHELDAVVERSSPIAASTPFRSALVLASNSSPSAFEMSCSECIWLQHS
jgi:hypothetical protein